MMSTTIDEVCAKAGVSADRLAQFQYTDEDILAGGLADVCDPWNLVGKHLGLQEAELSAINGDYKTVQEKRVAILQTRRDGRLDATYFLLVKALVSCRKIQQALKVCQVFSESHPDHIATGVGDKTSAEESIQSSSSRVTDGAYIHSVSPIRFSQDMCMSDFLTYLKARGLTNDRDQSIIQDEGISPQVFIALKSTEVDEVGFTFGGKKLLKGLLEELKGGDQSIRNDDGAKSLPTLTAQPHTGHTGNSKAPTLDDLVLLKYTKKGETKRVRIISEASHKWKDIASLICSDANKVRVLEQQHRGDPKECLRQTFVENFIDKEPQKYSQDWNGLIELLEDVDLETLAKQVKDALSFV